jgi:hypothetical protein
MGNHEWTVQRNRQHDWAQDMEQKQTQHRKNKDEQEGSQHVLKTITFW